MDDTFKIFVHRLKDGQKEKIDEKLPPDFLDVDGEGLRFPDPISVKGAAEEADGTLILQLEIATEVIVPCAICNEDVVIKIRIPNFYHTEDLADIKGAVFNYREILREAILLEVPFIAECHEGDCPERGSMAKYFAKGD